jgi:hypothetical protein
LFRLLRLRSLHLVSRLFGSGCHGSDVNRSRPERATFGTPFARSARSAAAATSLLPRPTSHARGVAAPADPKADDGSPPRFRAGDRRSALLSRRPFDAGGDGAEQRMLRHRRPPHDGRPP